MLENILSIFSEYHPQYLAGFWVTVQISLLGLCASLSLGTLIAVLCISPYKIIVLAGRAYIEFVRNIPLIIHVFFFYFGLPSLGVQIDSFTAGTLGLSIYTAAFMAEAIRAGIQSIPRGQSEAARAGGLSYLQTMRYVVLPQAFKLVIPPLGNQFLNLVKNSAILSVIAGMDLMYQADLIASNTFRTFETYILVMFFYLLLTIPLSILVNYLEKRLQHDPAASGIHA